jgi:hypothetical protein
MQTENVKVTFPPHLSERDLICILLSEVARTRSRIMLIEKLLGETTKFSADGLQEQLEVFHGLAYSELNSALKKWRRPQAAAGKKLRR